MRRIVKTHPPMEFKNWCKENREFNHAYSDLLGTKAHAALKQKLLEEQGWLCAYTGILLNDGSHVEHIKPQSKCADWEDVDYRNVLACFPLDGGDVSHGYGAPMKAGWWEESRFVSPLLEDSERRFRFSWSGAIYPNPENHEAAKETIAVLRLDNDRLKDLRGSRIRGFFGYGTRTRSRPLTIHDAKKALENIDQADSSGRLREFCFVLKQLLPKYIEKGKTK